MNRIKELREQKGIGQKVLAIDIGVSQPTICDWESGRKTPSSKRAAILADYFGVSLDYLLGREDPLMAAAYDTVLIQEFKSLPKEKREAALAYVSDSQLTARDKRDIARDMEQLTESIETSDALMFDGEPLSPEAKESLLAAMRLGLEAAKLKNKERFTPNKYRKD